MDFAQKTNRNQKSLLFDCHTGQLNISKNRLKPGSLIYRLFILLIEEPYPISIDSIFSSMFSGEYFNLHSSSNKVHQACFRLRSFIDQNLKDYKLSFDSEHYSLLKIKGPPVSLINLDKTLGENYQHKLEALKHLFKTCLLYTSPSPRDRQKSRMPSSA